MTENKCRIAGVLLAAGSSSRFGSPKQLVKIDDGSLVRRSALTLADAIGNKALVVIGCESDAVKAELTGLNVRSVFNPEWRQGIGSSITAAMKEIDENIDAVMITLCDQPNVARTDLTALIELYNSSEKSIAAAKYNKTLGVPAIFGRKYFAELAALEGDSGAKKIILSSDDVAYLEMPNAAIDIDTSDDLLSVQEK